MDTQKALQAAKKAAHEARQVLLSYYGNLSQIQEKFQAGLVSEADQESEKTIRSILLGDLPGSQFLGEESAYAAGTQASQGLDQSQDLWIVDPLDGTTNYIHQFPAWCISIGLQSRGQMQVAVIDVPILNETYWAVRGQGCFLNDQKISVSSTGLLKEALLATGFSGDKEMILQEQLRIFSKIVRQARGVRRPGAAAYDLALVARGVFDGFWERNLQPWDSAAGFLLVEEAGGSVTTFQGRSFQPFANSLVASNSKIHKELLSHFQGQLNPDTH